MSFRSKLIGTWECLSCTATNVNDPNDVHHPFTDKVKGTIIYSEDGYMAAMLQAAEIPKFTPGPLEGTDEEYAFAASKTQSYNGPFYLDEKGDKPRLYHHMLMALPPNYIGNTQIRWCEMREEGGQLYMRLGPDWNVQMEGAERRIEVDWKKKEPNTRTTPPDGA